MHLSRVRYVLAAFAVLALVGALAFLKFKQISMMIKFGETAKAAGPPPESVSTRIASEDTWDVTLPSVGSVEAARGVTLTNDAPGVVTAIRFESGALVKQGQVLVELDANVERAQLASATARRDLATLTVARTRKLFERSVVPGTQLEGDEAAIQTATADAAALQAQIARKIVRAPFAGRLGIRAINLGQYLNPGTPVTILESVDATYVDFTLPQQRLSEVPVGTPVRINIGGADGATIDGAVAAIDPTVDETTRSIRFRATATDNDKRLRPGMFVNVVVVLPTRHRVVTVPATSLVHASYGDSLFVVETTSGPDGKPKKSARQQFVRTSESRGDFIAIDDGLKAGQEVVVAGAFKLRNGAPVMINNDVKVTPELTPRPENR